MWADWTGCPLRELSQANVLFQSMPHVRASPLLARCKAEEIFTDEGDFTSEARIPVSEEAIDTVGVTNHSGHHCLAVVSAERADGISGC